MPLEAVLTDLDNTLYPYDPCHAAGIEAARAAATDRGYEFSTERFDGFYDAGRRDAKQDLAGTASAHNRYIYFKRAIEIEAGESRAADALAMADAYWDAYIDEMALVDGTRETLAALRDRDIPVALVTDLTTRIQLRKVADLGIDGRIDLLVTSEEVGSEKPDTVMFDEALTAFGVDAADAVMVGDDPAADIAGGNAAGLTTVLVGDAEPDGADQRPDHRIDAFPDLPEVVDGA